MYVVTQGEYSDYRITGIFSTEEKAKNYIANNKSEYSDYNDIEEFKLDELENNKNKTYYISEVKLSDGIVRDIEYNLDQIESVPSNITSKTTVNNLKNVKLRVFSFISQKHANKVCVEKYQLYVRLKNDQIYSEKLNFETNCTWEQRNYLEELLNNN